MPSFLRKIHPESNIDNFTRLDGTVTFFSFVKAAMKRVDARTVLDYGAGRGSFYHNHADGLGSMLKRDLMDLRSAGAEVWACDVDPVVLTHPASDHQVVIKVDAPLPFPDATFDMIVSEVTFEHVINPAPVAQELLRILKPGGYICARTPNKFGYVSIAAMIIPNRSHISALKRIAPLKSDQDIFPTFFRMNTVNTIKRLFEGCDVYWYRDSSEPSYYFNNVILYRTMLMLHKFLPYSLATSLCVFIRKPKPKSDPA